MDDRKQLWEEIGTSEAYWAVATHDKFRAANLDADLKEDFLDSGREHIDEVWTTFREILGKDLEPENAIDYGCGVGRLVIPIATRSKHAIGVDISSAMLREAKRNAEAAGCSNITLQSVDEFLRDEGVEYDLVHTYIVLQHIDPAIGYSVIEKLLERLKGGGYAMIHTTFKDTSPFFGRMRARVYRDVPGVHRTLNRLRGRHVPFVPVYTYDVERVRQIFAKYACETLLEKDTDHSLLGKMFFLRKGPSSA